MDENFKDITLTCKYTGEVVNNYNDYRRTNHWLNLKEEYYSWNKCVCEICDSTEEIDLYHKSNKSNEQNNKLGQEELEDLISLCNKCYGEILIYKKYYLFNRATDKQIDYVYGLLEEYIEIISTLFPNEFSDYYSPETIKQFDRDKLMCYEVRYLVDEIQHINTFLYWYYAKKIGEKMIYNPKKPLIRDEMMRKFFLERFDKFEKYIFIPQREEIEELINRYI